MHTLKRTTLITIAILGFFVFTHTAQAASLTDVVRGRILLDVEGNGAAWYVYPVNDYRYSLGSGKNAYKLMRTLGLGITTENLKKIPKASDTWTAEPGLMNAVRGRILLQVEKNGEAWYVNPVDGRRYYMKNGKAAYKLMRTFGLGITQENLARIPATTDPNAQPDYTGFQTTTVDTDRGSFAVSMITIQKSRYEMITDTANENDCDNNCPVKSLQDYVEENGAQIGINGSYFCPSDYSGCAGKVNSFLPPVFNSAADKMINEDALPFHAGPLLAVTSDNVYHYYHRSIDFGYSVGEWEAEHGATMRAGLTQYPSLVENGTIVVDGEPLESNQLNVRATRGGFGYNDQSIFLVVAKGATVPDLAAIMKTLGSTYAMNLDGGGSSALYIDGGYVVGPGRQLPNAIVFRRK